MERHWNFISLHDETAAKGRLIIYLQKVHMGQTFFFIYIQPSWGRLIHQIEQVKVEAVRSAVTQVVQWTVPLVARAVGSCQVTAVLLSDL